MMKMIQLTLIVLLIGSFTLSCSKRETAQMGADRPNPSASHEGILPEYQMKALDDAKQVEHVLKKSAEERRQQIEKQGH